jgi:hypothetical protein
MGSLYEPESMVLTTSIILTGKAPLMPPDSLHHYILIPGGLRSSATPLSEYGPPRLVQCIGDIGDKDRQAFA